jgi:hypothetical protein
LADAEGDVVELDVRQTSFVDPFGMTLLGESLLQLADYQQRVRVIGLDQQTGAYLHRMDVFQHVELVDGRLPEGRRRDRRDALSELRRIAGEDEAEEVATRLADALIGTRPQDPPQRHDSMHALEHEHQNDLIQYVLSELLSNALTHAQRRGFRGRARVWTAAQYYPSSDKVRLAVADTGCGLLATLRGHPRLEAETHFAAISAALLPRVSCNRNLSVRQDTVNEGVGLTTVHRIVDRSDGEMLVLTGNAYQRQRGGRAPCKRYRVARSRDRGRDATRVFARSADRRAAAAGRRGAAGTAVRIASLAFLSRIGDKSKHERCCTTPASPSPACGRRTLLWHAACCGAGAGTHRSLLGAGI